VPVIAVQMPMLDFGVSALLGSASRTSAFLLGSAASRVERFIADCEQIVARRQCMIADLDREGRDTTHARKLLADLENVQQLHIAERDRLLRELYKSNDMGRDGC
jgi:hypothetical protein